MGMFDEIVCKRKLPLTKEIKKAFPDIDWSEEKFQTKDLDNTMTTYIIKGTSLYWDRIEGEYIRTISEEEEAKTRKQKKFCWPYKFVESNRKTEKTNYHGTINFYLYERDKDGNTWDIEFDAIFNSGKLESIKLAKAEIVTTAEEHEKNEKEWLDRLETYERHPWTKTKKILNKITFNYWSTFWNNVARILGKWAQVLGAVQLWIYKNM